MTHPSDFWLRLPSHPGLSCSPSPPLTSTVDPQPESQTFSVTRAHVVSIGDSKVKPHALPPPGHAGPTRVDRRRPAMSVNWGVGEETSSAIGVCPSHLIHCQNVSDLLLSCSLLPTTLELKRNGFPPHFLCDRASVYHSTVRSPLWGVFSTAGDNSEPSHPDLLSNG